jgi:sRNA-binding protein
MAEQKHTQFQDDEQGVVILADTYPKAFFTDAKRRRPLKHGIGDDIKADIANNPENELRFFDIDTLLGHYIGHAGYQKNCSSPGTPRIDLTGKPVSKVTTAEARAAGIAAAEGFAIIEERKRAQRAIADQRLAAPVVNVAAFKTFSVNPNLTDAERLAAAQKILMQAEAILNGEFEAMWRREFLHALLVQAMEEIRTLDARITA